MTASQTTTSSFVKTKDGNSQTSLGAGDRRVEIARDLRVQDPFLHYSNDQVRMKKLLLQDDEEDSSDNYESSSPSSSSSSSFSSLANQDESETHSYRERKTRISFELHPLLILEDLLDDEISGDDSYLGVDILDVFSSLRTKEQGSDAMENTQ